MQHGEDVDRLRLVILSFIFYRSRVNFILEPSNQHNFRFLASRLPESRFFTNDCVYFLISTLTLNLAQHICTKEATVEGLSRLITY
jgi:hypothetical protein